MQNNMGRAIDAGASAIEYGPGSHIIGSIMQAHRLPFHRRPKEFARTWAQRACAQHSIVRTHHRVDHPCSCALGRWSPHEAVYEATVTSYFKADPADIASDHIHRSLDGLVNRELRV
jgi:hypothetical protein